jgi:hypothetical protein
MQNTISNHKRISRTNPPLVLVHLGKTIPLYLLCNIIYLKRIHKNPILISDSNKVISIVNLLGIETYFYEGTQQQMSALGNKLSHRSHFRDGFWYKAIIRFYAILEFMRTQSVESIIHCESDVWVSPRFPFDKFRDINSQLAFPITGIGLAVPSIVFIGKAKTLHTFLQFSEKIMQEDRSATDMSLLFHFAQCHPELVKVLPTLSRNMGNYNIDCPDSWISKISTTDFHGIFDGNTYGIYFWGWDPRNEKGFRRLFEAHQNHFLNPRGTSLKTAGDSLILRNSRDESEIYCLHIHSKDIRAFFVSSMRFVTWLRNLQQRDKVKVQFTFEVIRIKFRWKKQSLHRLIGRLLKTKEKR